MYAVTAAPKSKMAITLSSGAQSKTIHSVYVGIGGTLNATCAETGNSLSFVNVPSGAYILGPFSHLLATSTVSNLIGYY